MLIRSLILAVSIIALSCTSAQAGWFSREKEQPKAEEAHADRRPAAATKKTVSVAKNASTRAYGRAMQTMHKHMDAPLSGDVDVDFARQMIPHHQGAVEMAKIQLQYGHDERLKAFSRWVIQAQEQEIGFMTQWLRRRDNGAAPCKATDYFGEAMRGMHHGMMIRYTGDADVDFVRGMIPHHQGAVDMADIMFAQGSDPELNRLAGGIARSQGYEIAWMQRWLSEHAGK